MKHLPVIRHLFFFLCPPLGTHVSGNPNLTIYGKFYLASLCGGQQLIIKCHLTSSPTSHVSSACDNLHALSGLQVTTWNLRFWQINIQPSWPPLWSYIWMTSSLLNHGMWNLKILLSKILLLLDILLLARLRSLTRKIVQQLTKASWCTFRKVWKLWLELGHQPAAFDELGFQPKNFKAFALKMSNSHGPSCVLAIHHSQSQAITPQFFYKLQATLE